MTLKEFYVSAGKVGDWQLRRKIERVVMLQDSQKHPQFLYSWRDEMSDSIRQAIAEAKGY